ncbi:hypothetical protein D3Z48_14335 [Clostridiaceae bacterium]|nr:hypothetical protein [Clostridiaceae bacterium]
MQAALISDLSGNRSQLALESHKRDKQPCTAPAYWPYQFRRRLLLFARQNPAAHSSQTRSHVLRKNIFLRKYFYQNNPQKPYMHIA